MPTLSNERLCKLAQAGDTAARDILLENNLGFIRKIALEQYRSLGLDENDIGIDLDDLVQEGSIGLLNAIPLFDAGRGMKFLTYAAPAIRNAMTDCIRAALLWTPLALSLCRYVPVLICIMHSLLKRKSRILHLTSDEICGIFCSP